MCIRDRWCPWELHARCRATFASLTMTSRTTTASCVKASSPSSREDVRSAMKVNCKERRWSWMR
eukprot:332612-Heterocapsa_arctica.AAC.1